ncbi:Nucleolar complex protein 2-like protein, partial [Stegodyphus mimosarum]
MDPSKLKNWKKVQTMVRSYLIDMVKLLSLLKESSKLILLLKHVVHLVPFFSKFMKLCKHLLKKMITFWCSDEETVRVLSLIIIVRTRKSLPKEYFELVLKHMYFAYVRNSKFTSKSTWPLINFMKRSLTELYALNPEAAYEHTFVFVRQLAIHLRNAITTKKKESFQTVYNWQYVHCLLLWSHLVSRLHNQEAMKTLKYPLIQTIIGTITLIPTAKYVPLRFHLVKGLMEISKETGTFIPVMEFILDVLKIVDYNKKSSFSIKPVDFSCSLKGTKSQLTEAGYKDACISEVCTLLIEYLKMYSHSVGFPDLALKAIRDIKDFIKQCKVSKYNQQLKTLLGKIEENSLFICEKRRMVTFKITDGEQIKKWEEDIRMKGTPLLQLEKEVPETKDNKCKDVEESRKKKRKFNAKV